MTTIKERLQADMKEAMRAKDKQKLTTIRLIIDQVQKKEKELLSDLDESGVIAVVQSYKKSTVEEKDGFEKAGNLVRVAEKEAEIELIMSYLPAQMSKEEIQAIVQGIVTKLGEKANMGAVMKEVMPLVKGKADNKLVNEVVQESLK